MIGAEGAEGPLDNWLWCLENLPQATEMLPRGTGTRWLMVPIIYPSRLEITHASGDSLLTSATISTL